LRVQLPSGWGQAPIFRSKRLLPSTGFRLRRRYAGWRRYPREWEQVRAETGRWSFCAALGPLFLPAYIPHAADRSGQADGMRREPRMVAWVPDVRPTTPQIRLKARTRASRERCATLSRVHRMGGCYGRSHLIRAKPLLAPGKRRAASTVSIETPFTVWVERIFSVTEAGGAHCWQSTLER